MAARYAAAFVLALALQVAAASYSCGCGPVVDLPGPYPGPYPGKYYGAPAVVEYAAPAYYGAVDYAPAYAPAYAPSYAPAYAGPVEVDVVGPVGVVEGYGPYAGAYSSGPYAGAYSSGPTVVSSGPASVVASSPATVVSSSPAVPVGAPSVVSKTAGAASSYITAPNCQTAAYELPVQSYSSAAAGPVAESTEVVDGCCSSSCAATRAKCSGTTKKVSFKTPVIIDKGSSTSSSVSVVGGPVASRNTKAGVPQVSTQVYPAPSAPGPVAYGPAPYVAAGPVAYGPEVVEYGYPAEYYGGYYPGYAGPSCACACA